MDDEGRADLEREVADPDVGDGGVRAFLIADVRGYTRFTQERGDEAAAELAARFATVVREVVEAAGGDLLELRGDEALVVFDSPRQAVRASLALRDRLIDETLADPSRPLPVGMGLDVGEAVAVEGGFRGGALNVAARLCSSAGPGEILASRELVHLARRIDGVRYAETGRLQLKGLDRSTTAVRIMPEEDRPDRIEAFTAIVRSTHARSERRRALVVIAAVTVAAASATAAMLFTRQGSEPLASRPNAVGTIELSTAEVTGWIDVDNKPVSVASGAGSLWVANEEGSSISRIDPDSNSLEQTIPVPGRPVALDFAEEALWVSIPETGTVLRVNPATNTPVQTIEVGNEPIDIAVDEGELWVANRADSSVGRYSTEDGTELANIHVGRSPTGIAVGDDVWVTNAGDGTVSRIEKSSDQAVDLIAVGSNPTDAELVGQDLWVANNLDGTVSRIDTSSGSVSATVAVGSGPRSVTFGGGSLWIANEHDGTITQMDPSTGEVTAEIEVGNAPQGLAIAGDRLWFSTRARQLGHRGGTLRIAGSADSVDSIDPHISYSFETWQLLLLQHDGLVTFKKVGGADGATLVPDLAVSIPTPSSDGRSYTFELRPDLEYSDGRPVQASDVTASIERLFRLRSDGTFYYDTIVGTDKCNRRRCDLSQSVRADNASRTITFKLVAPDPEFLYKLALPFAFVLPSDTPPSEIDTPGVPVTGPYVLDRFDPDGDLVMVRNENFKEWSPAAQPDGFVDQIVFTPLKNESSDRTLPVERGEADLAVGELGFDPEIHRRLARDYTERLHTHPTKATIGLVMNTEAAPFDDPDVRKAVNYALDRARLVEHYGGGEEVAQVTCQILPPGIPGYEPYCPYTISPETGDWSSPDISRAQELIDKAGAAGVRVVLWEAPFSVAGGREVVGTLRKIGLDAELNFVKDQRKYFASVHDPRTRPQIFSYGWLADYAVPSNFLNILFSCDSFSNVSGACDQDLERDIDRALRLDLTDPSAARNLWTKIDRKATDLAAWAPVLNPRGSDFVSERVGNYQYHPQWGALLAQIWVK